MDGYVQRIAAAQDAAGDGYLNTCVRLHCRHSGGGAMAAINSGITRSTTRAVSRRPACTTSQTGGRHEFELCCRIPGWCERWSASVGGEPVELDLSMEPVRIQANPSVQDDRGRVAVQRGPILYCFEAVDNARLPEPVIDVNPQFTVRREARLLGDVVMVEVAAGDGSRLTAVPFYARGNRGDGPDEYEVWVTQEVAVPDSHDGAPAWLYRPYR